MHAFQFFLLTRGSNPHASLLTKTLSPSPHTPLSQTFTNTGNPLASSLVSSPHDSGSGPPGSPARNKQRAAGASAGRGSLLGPGAAAAAWVAAGGRAAVGGGNEEEEEDDDVDGTEESTGANDGVHGFEVGRHEEGGERCHEVAWGVWHSDRLPPSFIHPLSAKPLTVFVSFCFRSA